MLLVGLTFATMIQSFSWNQTSHYDLIRSLDNGGTTIDAYQANTGDKVFYKGHYYSARAPGLALFALPFYEALNLVDADRRARDSQALRSDDEMIYFIGLWANVLPGLVLLLLVWRVAERFEPGYGARRAVILGLGTMVLPLSTLLFSHVFAAMLGFAAFALMLRERDGPAEAAAARARRPGDGLCGRLGVPRCCSCARARAVPALAGGRAQRAGLASRAGAYIAGGDRRDRPAAALQPRRLPLLDAPRLLRRPPPAERLLRDRRTQPEGARDAAVRLARPADDLSGAADGGVGTVLLYRRGARAEALTIPAICLCYVGYNSGYYLPFGGGFMGPRFLTTMLPFLAFPIALALRRFPGPTIALAAVSIAAAVIATITHPLVGYENETVIWGKLLLERQSGTAQPSSAARGLLPADDRLRLRPRPQLGRDLAVRARRRRRRWCSPRVACPRLADARRQRSRAARSRARRVGAVRRARPDAARDRPPGLLSIVGAGDHTALNLKLHDGSRYPLRTLAPIAAVVGLLALALLR